MRFRRTDKYAETADEYCARMQDLLPRFPADVLKQWFYDHWSDIDNYAWLDFTRLGFTKHRWQSQEVMGSGIQDNESIRIDHQHYEAGLIHFHGDRMVDYFRSHGTWPVSPVFLANPSADIVRPDGFELTAPYHLLEGHHRAGYFWSFFESNALQHVHKVWVAALTSENGT